MLLEIELSRVKTPCVTESGELSGRKDRFQEFAGREGEQLGDISRDRDTGLTNAEELVDKPSVKQLIRKCTPRVPSIWQGLGNTVMIDVPGRDEDCSDEPGTEGTRGHRGIVVVINHSTDLGIWGVLVE